MSEEEREAGIPEVEEKHEIKTKTETQERIVETKKEGGFLKNLSQLEMVLLVLLALVVGFILAYILPRLLEKLREPEVQYVPHYIPFVPPPPMRPHRRKHRKAGADVDPRMLLRTPPELRRHNIYLDEYGECVLASPPVFEMWQIERSEDGQILDARKVQSEEE